jgi:hypothetical protein
MIIMLAIGPKVCRFKLSRGNGFLRVIKIHSTPSFRGEVKPSAPCREILWHIKKVCEYERYFVDTVHNFLCPDPPELLLDGSIGRIAREHSGG